MRDTIEVIGARQNNLKNIDVKIPRNKLTVVTGISGSGKSSLAFDVVFGEGQRLFLESLSTYARSKVVQVRRPDVDFVFGLSSVVSIEQHRGVRNLRSTVGTLTTVETYLRLLFSVQGEAYCPYCDTQVPVKTANQIVEYILSLPEGTMVELLVPVFKIYGENYRYLFDDLRRRNIGSIRINGEQHDIGDKIELDEDQDYRMEAFIDTFEVTSDLHQEMLDRVRECQRIGEGFIRIEVVTSEDSEAETPDFFEVCPEHHILMGELLPWYFSPNEGDSACLTCAGLGIHRKAVPFLMIENEQKSIRKGAINSGIYNMNHPFKYLVMYSLAEHYGFSLDEWFSDLTEEAKELLFYGTKGEKFELKQPPDLKQSFAQVGREVSFEGLCPPIDRWYKNAARHRQARSMDEHIYFRGMIDVTCPDCNGTKLLPQRLQVRIKGKNIHELGDITLTELREFLEDIEVS
ncbi:MAG: excinuclease ABC subunit UvrA, partial [Candidatus Hodarchaeales archaeon]